MSEPADPFISAPPVPVSLHTLKVWLAMPYPVHVSREVTDWMRCQLKALVAQIDQRHGEVDRLSEEVKRLEDFLALHDLYAASRRPS